MIIVLTITTITLMIIIIVIMIIITMMIIMILIVTMIIMTITNMMITVALSIIIVMIITRKLPKDNAVVNAAFYTHMHRVVDHTDGIGTPDSDPRHLVNWYFLHTVVNLTCF